MPYSSPLKNDSIAIIELTFPPAPAYPITSASDDFDETYPTKVVVTNDGNCLWVPPGMFKSTCAIDITWFPFDDQQCMLKFGSWTLTGGLLNLTQDQTEGGDTSSFIRNGEWMLIGGPGFCSSE